ncbi:LysR family transcriptional regulator [Beduini massiliensis]|uniref:LysR family transcriptional regulator n=1 Tax=Beduini massiliensis TaxID=1585974 RepID=UPI00059AAD15|nr:LysR family transcriptional regulator [Beduini massiliensis]
MTLRHLKIFSIVYQLQNITKAAATLHIAQPSVSIAIKELENYYGIVLFDRINKRIYPTQTAHKLYGYALHIIDLYEEMETDIKNWEDDSPLKVGCSITIGNFIFPQLIKEWEKKLPKMKFKAIINNSQIIEERILNNEIDIALIEGKGLHPDQLIQTPFLEDHLCLIVSNDHPLTKLKRISLEKLLDYPFLLRESGSGVRDLVDALFLTHHIELSPIVESTSTQAIVRAVNENVGISILPYLMVKEDINKGNIISLPIKDLDLSRQFSIIYHKNKYLTHHAKAFIDLCQSWAENQT